MRLIKELIIDIFKGGILIEKEKIAEYINGNTKITLYADGTKIRETDDNVFIPFFAENMDIKICNCCDRGCTYCHEGSTPDGKLGDILNETFINTLHPYQEIALGGGNVLQHPDLIPFLYKLKELKVITNITLNQYHFEQNFDKVYMMMKEKLFYGLGVSLENPTKEFIKKIKRIPNAVIHVINGIVTEKDIIDLAYYSLKILILGYKHLRRGNTWFKNKSSEIQSNQLWLKKNIEKILFQFKVVSFDNLAIEQLDVKNLLTDEEWNLFYAGDDGSHTYYIDMVERKFAKSSTASLDERYDLMDSVDSMFKKIQENK